MKILNFLYKSPITWLIVLALLQVYVAVVLQPSPEKNHSDVIAFEEIMIAVEGNPELSKLVEARQATLESKNETIEALTTFQKTIGGFSAIILVVYVFLSYRKLNK